MVGQDAAGRLLPGSARALGSAAPQTTTREQWRSRQQGTDLDLQGQALNNPRTQSAATGPISGHRRAGSGPSISSFFSKSARNQSFRPCVAPASQDGPEGSRRVRGPAAGATRGACASTAAATLSTRPSAPLAAQAEGGKIKLLRGAWNKDFLDELELFPFGRHDDAVDAAARTLTKLAWHQPRPSEPSVVFGSRYLHPGRERM
jgi:hypothetical protein